MSAANRDKLRQAFKLLESFLEGKQYFAGEHPTIADISIVSNIIQAKYAFGVIGNFPNLINWFERSRNLKGFVENAKGGSLVMDAFNSRNIKLVQLS